MGTAAYEGGGSRKGHGEVARGQQVPPASDNNPSSRHAPPPPLPHNTPTPAPQHNTLQRGVKDQSTADEAMLRDAYRCAPQVYAPVPIGQASGLHRMRPRP